MIINEQPIICWGVNCGIFDSTNKMIIDILIEKGANPENILIPYRRLGNTQGLSVVVNKMYKPLDNIDIAEVPYTNLRYIGYDALEYEILQLYTYYTLSFIKLRSVTYRIEHYHNTSELRLNKVNQQFKNTIQDSVDKLRKSNITCADKIIAMLYTTENADSAIRGLIRSKKEIKVENENLYKDILHQLRQVNHLETDLANAAGYAVLGVNIPNYSKNTAELTNRPIIIIERYRSDIINKIPDEYINISIVAPAWQVTDNLHEAKVLATCDGRYPFEITKELSKEYTKQLVTNRYISCQRNIDIKKRDVQLRKALNIVKQCYKLGIYVRSIEDDSITFAIKANQDTEQLLRIVRNSEFIDKVRKIVLHSNDSIIYTIRTYKNKNTQDLYIKEI